MSIELTLSHFRRQREEELKHAAEVRQLYEKRLAEAAEILDELRERESKLRKR